MPSTTNDPGSGAKRPVPGEHRPFAAFVAGLHEQTVLRAAITAACRPAEAGQVAILLSEARLPADIAAATHRLACRLAGNLRARQAGSRAGLVQGLLREFSLSSQEGVALMCLAEALLRIPDPDTRDALIRDKIGAADWRSHLGKSESPFINAATWGLMITGRLVATHEEAGLGEALRRVLAHGGEPVVRKGVDLAMRLMAEHFVVGETIQEALANAARFEPLGFRYSYDMLGEAALTDDDALRYLDAYEAAIATIGSTAAGLGIHRGPGISIKLSALHPRYSRAQHERVMAELYPRLRSLALLARHHDIGLNIDAEEADRLDISLDLLERLCHEPALTGWDGVGFVVQAYQKRCLAVVDWLVDLARRSGHRLMVRLVKGAYWDSEIKRAQLAGLEDYPVYTRKAHTDLSYLACARRLLAAPAAVFPQFATHNAHTLAAVHHLAGADFHEGRYEFQCLHGMGEPLYEQVVGPVAAGGLGRPCRIYAPVGSHQTLLAYLVRRLLENGANTSFIHRLADPAQSIASLVADPVAAVEATALVEGRAGLPHPCISLPRDLYRDRPNSLGLDLVDEQRLASLGRVLVHSAHHWQARPMLAPEPAPAETPARRPVRNPARHEDVVGEVQEASLVEVDRAVQAAEAAFVVWRKVPTSMRAGILEQAADRLEAGMQPLLGLLVREAGKTFANAVAEVREAVDFLRYYAADARACLPEGQYQARGPVACISPWNFPLAIFTGQIAAALAAGNTVLAKPAEQTPLIAAQAVAILQAAGLPPGVLQMLPGTGEKVGAALVADRRVQAVIFTGSIEVARIVQGVLARRLDSRGRPVPLVAETGGLNTMIVDSSALGEQVVADVLASAFDSAGQRCSALRVLCLQQEIAERTIVMLEGAMRELAVGDPEHLCVDIGPVIDDTARQALERHIAVMRARGRRVFQACRPRGDDMAQGSFVAPTLVEIKAIDELGGEIFGPVLHVLRFPRHALDTVLEAVDASGYGLTLGLHSRIDETIRKVAARARVGNLYVNRNMVGAVVGVQPFGGERLSGTGPKAGGPLYMRRLLASAPPRVCLEERLLDGPTGERNTWRVVPRSEVMCLAANEADLRCQLTAVLAVGSRPACRDDPATRSLAANLPAQLQVAIRWLADWTHDGVFTALLHHGDTEALIRVGEQLASRPGPIVDIQGLRPGERDIALERLYVERSLSINTAAAGGNASLMRIG